MSQGGCNSKDHPGGRTGQTAQRGVADSRCWQHIAALDGTYVDSEVDSGNDTDAYSNSQPDYDVEGYMAVLGGDELAAACGEYVEDMLCIPFAML